MKRQVRQASSNCVSLFQIPRYIITLHELLAHTPHDHVERESLEYAKSKLEELSRVSTAHAHLHVQRGVDSVSWRTRLQCTVERGQPDVPMDRCAHAWVDVSMHSFRCAHGPIIVRVRFWLLRFRLRLRLVSLRLGLVRVHISL